MYCVRCERDLPESDFNNQQRQRVIKGLRGWCSDCIIKRCQQLRQERMTILVDAWGGGCQICGYNKCLAALDFHHTDPALKGDIAPSSLIHQRQPPEAATILWSERCVLLCANCHRETHYYGIDLSNLLLPACPKVIIPTKGRLITIDGQSKNIKGWLHHFGISRTVFQCRRKAGWPIEKALSTPPDNPKKMLITIGGQTKSLWGWCNHYGVTCALVFGRIQRGWEPEKALTTPSKFKRIDWPSDLKYLVESSSITEVAKLLGASRAAVLNRLKSLSL